MNCLEALEKPRSQTAPGLPLLLVAAAALIDKDGRVLVAQRPEGKPMAGLWEFPGGKVKDGETPEFALCREIDADIQHSADHLFRLPDTLVELTPVLAIVPLQLLAYFIARNAGCEIDQPRNLAKSVTVE